MMCQQCVDLVRQYFPNLPQEDYGELLIGATCFPFGGPDLIEPQLRELRENTDGSLLACLAYADEKVWEEMKRAEEGPIE